MRWFVMLFFDIIDKNFSTLIVYLTCVCSVFSYVHLKMWLHRRSLNCQNEIHLLALLLRLRSFAIDGRKLWCCEAIFLLILLLQKLVSGVILKATSNVEPNKLPLVFTESTRAHYFTLCIPDVVKYCSSILMIQQLGRTVDQRANADRA